LNHALTLAEEVLRRHKIQAVAWYWPLLARFTVRIRSTKAGKKDLENVQYCQKSSVLKVVDKEYVLVQEIAPFKRS
jgi:hypothetical protein